MKLATLGALILTTVVGCDSSAPTSAPLPLILTGADGQKAIAGVYDPATRTITLSAATMQAAFELSVRERIGEVTPVIRIVDRTYQISTKDNSVTLDVGIDVGQFLRACLRDTSDVPWLIGDFQVATAEEAARLKAFIPTTLPRDNGCGTPGCFN